MQVIISTQVRCLPNHRTFTFELINRPYQEPSAISPMLIDLSTITILHRFQARSWWKHLSDHISAELTEEDFDRVIKLKVTSDFSTL
jgi:hypothetical protein